MHSYRHEYKNGIYTGSKCVTPGCADSASFPAMKASVRSVEPDRRPEGRFMLKANVR